MTKFKQIYILRRDIIIVFLIEIIDNYNVKMRSVKKSNQQKHKQPIAQKIYYNKPMKSIINQRFLTEAEDHDTQSTKKENKKVKKLNQYHKLNTIAQKSKSKTKQSSQNIFRVVKVKKNKNQSIKSFLSSKWNQSVNLYSNKKSKHNYQHSCQRLHHNKSIYTTIECQKSQKKDNKSKNEKLGKKKSKKKSNQQVKADIHLGTQTKQNRQNGLRYDIKIVKQIGEGAFGKVFKVEIDGQVKALKKVFQDNRYKNRQKNIIKNLNNSFLIKIDSIYETKEEKGTYLNIIMDYYPQNLAEFIQRRGPISGLELKIILYQIFRGLNYLHSQGITHRDIKPHNIMMSEVDYKIVICDLGSAKKINKNEKNISYICSRCYRAPELIFGCQQYSGKIDVWSAGCIILELIQGKPMFLGQNNIDQMLEIIRILGTPSHQEICQMNPYHKKQDFTLPTIPCRKWKSVLKIHDSFLINLIESVMVFSPKKRLSSIEILSHKYFDELRDKSVYEKLLKSKTINSSYFIFSESQLKGSNVTKEKVIPNWFEQQIMSWNKI